MQPFSYLYINVSHPSSFFPSTSCASSEIILEHLHNLQIASFGSFTLSFVSRSVSVSHHERDVFV